MSGGSDLNPSPFTPGVSNLICQSGRWCFPILLLCRVEDEPERVVNAFCKLSNAPPMFTHFFCLHPHYVSVLDMLGDGVSEMNWGHEGT